MRPSLSERVAAATVAARTRRPESDALRELEAETAWIIARERGAAQRPGNRLPTRCECCNGHSMRGRLCAGCRADLKREGDLMHLSAEGFRVTITRSAGSDGAVVVFIDGPDPDTADLMPNGTPRMRVLLNDDPIYEAVAYEPAGT